MGWRGPVGGQGPPPVSGPAPAAVWPGPGRGRRPGSPGSGSPASPYGSWSLPAQNLGRVPGRLRPVGEMLLLLLGLRDELYLLQLPGKRLPPSSCRDSAHARSLGY